MNLVEYKIKYPPYSIVGDMISFGEVCEIIYRVKYNSLDDIELYFYKGKNQETINDNYFDDCKTFYLYWNYKYFNNKLNINNLHYINSSNNLNRDGYDSEIHIINNKTKEVGVVRYGSLYMYDSPHESTITFLDKDRIKEFGLEKEILKDDFIKMVKY